MITIGCVNEHVGPVGDCEQHARQLTNSLARLVCGHCGAPLQILRTEPEMPPPTGINALLSDVFDGKPGTSPVRDGKYWQPERMTKWTEDH